MRLDGTQQHYIYERPMAALRQVFIKLIADVIKL